MNSSGNVQRLVLVASTGMAAGILDTAGLIYWLVWPPFSGQKGVRREAIGLLRWRPGLSAEAEKLCRQVAVIRHGQLLAVGKPDELRAASSSGTVQVAGGPFGCDVLARLRARDDVLAADEVGGELQLELRHGASAAPVVRLLVEWGVAIEEVRRGGASLADVFVALVGEEARDA